MPSKQAFCWCFGGRPPDIKYGIDGETQLKAMTVDIPMPTDENELNTMFEELVAELDLDKPHRDALFNLQPEKKWQIYCSKKQGLGDANSPGYYIDRINSMSTIISYNEEELEQREKTVENLKTALRTQPMSFVTEFLELDGLQCLGNFLTNMDYQVAESSIHTAVIGCFKALMNSSQGRAHVLAHPNSINVIAQSLSSDNIKTKIAVFEILGAMCLVPGGHRKVLEAMIHYQKYAAERTRFQSLVYDLDRSTGVYREEVNLKTAIMSFINAVLRCGPGKDYLEFRLHLRYEFLMLGIQPVIEKLRKHDNATLDRHLDFFEMMRNDDEKVLAKKFEGAHVDTKSASTMFELLRKKLFMAPAYTHLLSLLQHLLLIPYANSSYTTGMWLLIDKIVQQVVLQKNGHDYDYETLEINVKKTILMLTNETDIKSYQQKLREVEKANDEIQSKLTKKEREAEIRTQEKEELLDTVNKMKTKLEKETAGHQETKQHINDLNRHIEELKAQLEAERGERMKLQHLVKTGSLPDDAKVGLSSVSVISDLKSMSSVPIPTSSVPPPPALPPPGLVPPPPPAPGAPPPPSMFGVPGTAQRRNVPKPKQPLKSFNWTKLDDNKIKGSVWNDLDDTKLYSLLDLEDFEKTFSAYQKKQQDETDDAKNSGKTPQKTKELSVIDGRRAQNCTILLSKLKVSNEEIKTAVLNMDEHEDIPKDMLEQLLKYVPTSEEMQLLTELGGETENLARADRFLFEMGKISHYEQRVRALYFKKKYQDRMSDVKPRIEAVFEGSKQLMRSRRVKKLLELVLALGNYMNRGQRGNARGFAIISLNNMVDTKSGVNKQVTLLHYLVETVEKRFPDVTKIEQDLSLVHAASKVNFSELDKELGTLRTGLKEIEKELTYFQNQPQLHGDRFVTVMTQFATVASYNFSEVEETYTEMKQKFELCQKNFGISEGSSQPDEFFGIFDTFLASMKDAKLENEKIKKQKEEEEKRVQLEEKLKKEREHRAMKKGSTLTTDSNGQVVNGTAPKGEFDDLVSALRTGDIFGDDLAKMKRNRKRISAQVNTSRERVN
ncbi:disheveled-associated activator of morphogenesis 1-like [Ruditapes philippinarum]|uniref:disheveled-associated activator of morphogenesis 1-like n=1 Tax=Ruditapes philippinarum TaxID=129788 RepID=UPI00295A9E2E|nr:disheveled-associated activator of morphogenesis 1-like [Ruditapes philippinarum]XP_060571051.1 disheveled-associated activator of morphogenesis 1-like [Ruditapes philippinarum]XP_060571052.1 disheveled-associated activator of morphogenesis 1-like [Ruditapes philippinarum]XP_060571053.1 disheveled-associated activator of morphogenesis 1-like [Ruditapes philippinarum]XP_060571054.1 disheveled-associated activator of morphogenesis 1-like [Ruditapes philippinarum]